MSRQPCDPQIIVDAINAAARRLSERGYKLEIVVERNPEDGLRRHLGASVIGSKCARRIFYGWRWCGVEDAEGRMIRLWSRGDIEEARFAFYLREAGVELWTEDPSTGRQFQFSDIDGHYGGSSDGVGRRWPGCDPNLAALTEYKTSNDKQFKKLVKEGVGGAKFQHWVQMQTYMAKFGLQWAIYFCVNKDNDEIHAEWVALNIEQANHFRERAKSIIFAEEPPARISDRRSWFECKFCEHIELCHGTAVPLVNCRTCAHSTPGPGKSWLCARGHLEINGDPKRGCGNHVFNPNLLNKVRMTGGSHEENWVELALPDGTVIQHGPDHVTSQDLRSRVQL